MKKTVFYVLMVISTFIGYAQQWQYVGNQGIGQLMGDGYNQSLALDTNGIPYVAYVDEDRDYKVSVIAFFDGTWDTVGNGGISLNSVTDNPVKIKINPVTNQPYVLFSDDAMGDRACLMFFNGSYWDTVGNYPFTQENVIQLDLAFSQDGVPYVSFGTGDNVNGNMNLTVMKYDNNTWSVVGSDTVALLVISYGNTDIEVNSQGNPYVVFKDGAGNKISVKYFDGLTWKYYGDSLFSQETPGYMDLEFDSEDNVYVAYKDGWNAIIKTWSGSQWDTIGEPFPSSEDSYFLDFEINQNNELWIAYERDNGYSPKPLRVQKFDGQNWGYVGATNVSEGTAYFTNLEFNKNNVAYVAFQDHEYYDWTSVMKYDELTNSFYEKENSELAIYPTIVKDLLFITVENEKSIFYSIFTVNGNLVKQGVSNGVVDVSRIKAGTYILEINTNDGVKTSKKFIKE